MPSTLLVAQPEGPPFGRPGWVGWGGMPGHTRSHWDALGLAGKKLAKVLRAACRVGTESELSISQDGLLHVLRAFSNADPKLGDMCRPHRFLSRMLRLSRVRAYLHGDRFGVDVVHHLLFQVGDIPETGCDWTRVVAATLELFGIHTDVH